MNWLRKAYLSIGRQFGLLDHETWKWLYGASWQPGREIDGETSMRLAVVWSCVRILVETLGSLPLQVFREQGSGGRSPAPDHPVAKLLRNPNPTMTRVEFIEACQLPLVLRGNAYAEIGRYDGEPRTLTPLDCRRLQHDKERRIFHYGGGDRRREIPETNVLHLKGFGDGETGLSPIRHAMNALRAARNAEEYGSRFFEHGARPGGYIKTPGDADKTRRDRIREIWREYQEESSDRLLILPYGLEYQSVGIPPEEAQFIESRKFSVIEICRMFRVPPHMVYQLERASYANSELQGLDFDKYTLRPYLTRWEQALNRKLFEPGSEYFVKFNLEGLLRGDSAARASFYSTALQNGWMSRNEVRAKEDMNSVDGGDEYTVQVNLQPLSQLADQVQKGLALIDARLEELSGKQQLHLHVTSPVKLPEIKASPVHVTVEAAKREVA